MKRKPSRRAAVSEQARSISVREVAELLSSIPELRESYSPAEMELALEDIGYISPMGRRDSNEFDPVSRRRIVTESRRYWRGDPLAKQAVRLWTDYVVGTGITFKTSDAAQQKDLTTFFKHRKNKRMTRSSGQQRLSRKLLVDGEIFFAIFGGQGEAKVLRTIDPLQIDRVISDPDDEEEILCYKRVDRSNQPKTTYYRDWAADDDDLKELKDPDTGKAITPEEDVVVYHLPFDDIGIRGNGLLFPVVFWSKEHRRFMEARVSITQALAKFAHKLTVKGGQKAVDAVQKKMQSSIAASGAGGRGVEKNPPPVPGSTWAQNLGIDLEAMPRATGAGDAKQDGDQLKLMFCAGVNLPQHYFGDASNANLATATAMELPVCKSFTAYQELWKDAWRDIFSIVLEEDPDEEAAAIFIELPLMLKDDLRGLGTFLTGLHQVFPQIEIPEILQMCLVSMGVNDIDDVMKSAAARKTELANAAEKVPTHQVLQPLPAGTPPTTPVAPGSAAPVSEAYIAAMNNLAEAIRAA